MAAPPPAPHFVLSYGRADGPYVAQFYEDLADSVRNKHAELKGLDASAIGYMDTRTDHGDHWDAALVSALRRAKTYVGLVSVSYLASDYCGREFALFQRRVENHAPALAGGNRPKLIKPVMWQPERRLGPLPEALSLIQHSHHDYGAVYQEKGLATLIKLARHRDDYEEFLDTFGWALVKDAQECVLPEISAGPTLDDVVSPFRNGGGPSAPRLSGPNSVTLIFVAGTRDEMGHDSYSGLGRDWRPFGTPVGTKCSSTLGDEQLFPLDAVIGPDTIGQIRQAEQENSIVLLIVDPRSTRLDRFREFLEKFDEGAFVNTGVLVLWNPDDEGAARDEVYLRNHVRSLLSRTVVMNGHLSDSVRDADQLREELVAAVHEIRRRMAARGSVFQSAGVGNTSLPRIAGPGGER